MAGAQILGDGKDADTFPNSLGLRLVDYVDAIVRLGAKHKLPVCDLYRTSGINRDNYHETLSDGLHLAKTGEALVATQIAATIAPLL